MKGALKIWISTSGIDVFFFFSSQLVETHFQEVAIFITTYLVLLPPGKLTEAGNGVPIWFPRFRFLDGMGKNRYRRTNMYTNEDFL